MRDLECPQIFHYIWKSSSRMKHKNFFWLVAHNRVNTRSLLQRKIFILEDYYCPNCNQNVKETLMRLLWDRRFAQACWDTLITSRRRESSIYDDTMLALASKSFLHENCNFALLEYLDPKEWKIFRGSARTIQCRRYALKEDRMPVKIKIRDKHAALFQEWLTTNF